MERLSYVQRVAAHDAAYGRTSPRESWWTPRAACPRSMAGRAGSCGDITKFVAQNTSGEGCVPKVADLQTHVDEVRDKQTNFRSITHDTAFP